MEQASPTRTGIHLSVITSGGFKIKSKTIWASTKWILTACSLVALWSLISLLIASKRGLDLTDEGLYLLASDPPSNTATWGFPAGWHTSPLFRAVSFQIDHFRTLGAMLLVFASGSLGYVATRSVIEMSDVPTDISASRIATIGGGTAAVASLLFYGGLLRTPSYNWVNVTGMVIAAAGQIELVRRVLREGRIRSLSSIFTPTMVAGFGLFYSLPGKPSTPVLQMLLFIVLAIILLGLRNSLILAPLLTLATFAWILFAQLVGLWPAEWFSVFLRAARAPTPVSSQTPTGALIEYAYSIQYPLKPLLNLFGVDSPRLSALFAVLVVAAVGAFILRNQVLIKNLTPQLPWWAYLLFMLLTVIYLRPGFSLLWVEPLPRFANSSAATVGLMLFLFALRETISQVGPSKRRTLKIRPFAIGLFLLALPFVSGLGSSNGPYPMAVLAGGPLFLSSFVLYAPHFALPRYRIGALYVTFIALVAVGANFVDSWKLPYRIAPISEQVLEVEIGTRGSTLLLDSRTAQLLIDLTRAGNDLNLTGQPWIGLDANWSSTVPFHLGMRVPESLMISLDSDTEIASYNLRNQTTLELISDALVSTTPLDLLDPDALEKSIKMFEVFSELSGRNFPEDYTCVVRLDSVEIWKLAGGEDGVSSRC